MGLLKGTLTFSRYRVTGDLPDNFSAFVNKQIRKFAFQDLTAETEDVSMGWTSLENILDTRFEYANYALGDYLLFNLRMDRKTVPPALLRIRAGEAEKAYRAERKLERLYREQRKQIAEAVRLDLLGKALPVPSFHEVCWCVSKKWLLFGSHAEKTNEHFTKLFERSFQAKLLPYAPWEPDVLEPATAEELKKMEEAPAFLGREFLTWLWYKSEERNGTISLDGASGGKDIEMIFSRRITLESGNGEYAETVSCQGLHSEMREGKAALKAGKKIKEARIRLKTDHSECEFTLKADGFQVQSLKMPQPVDSAEGPDRNAAEEPGGTADRDGRILERIYHLETVMDTLDSLFSLFLKRRLSRQWSSEEVVRMKRWVE